MGNKTILNGYEVDLCVSMLSHSIFACEKCQDLKYNEIQTKVAYFFTEEVFKEAEKVLLGNRDKLKDGVNMLNPKTVADEFRYGAVRRHNFLLKHFEQPEPDFIDVDKIIDNIESKYNTSYDTYVLLATNVGLVGLIIKHEEVSRYSVDLDMFEEHCGVSSTDLVYTLRQVLYMYSVTTCGIICLVNFEKGTDILKNIINNKGMIDGNN